MSTMLKQLEDALASHKAAEVYFETAYTTYRLACKHLDEKEAAVAVARDALAGLPPVDTMSEEDREGWQDSMTDSQEPGGAIR